MKVLLAAVVSLVACVIAPATGFAAEDALTQQASNLRDAINTSDVDRAAALFADDAVVIQPRIGGYPQVYLGQDQIRWWLRNLLIEHVQYGLSAPPAQIGTHVHWADSFSADTFRSMGLRTVEFESDAVIGPDERIVSLTTVFTPEAARAVQGATREDALPAGLVPVSLSNPELPAMVFPALTFCLGGLSATLILKGRRLRPVIPQQRF